ncbi:uncharacterized protein UHOD_11656 [Ustilago sp. UG-2017b]|nr:uncharacterized protein UHOD_11656 [Ustilago sp. UG-2017b]
MFLSKPAATSYLDFPRSPAIGTQTSSNFNTFMHFSMSLIHDFALLVSRVSLMNAGWNADVSSTDCKVLYSDGTHMSHNTSFTSPVLQT